MKDFLCYLRSVRRSLWLFALFACVFLVTFSLYGLPLSAVWYPFSICAAIGLVTLILFYLRFRRRLRELSRLGDDPLSFLRELPTPDDRVEEAYQAILSRLSARFAAAEADAETKYRDMIEYYTIWAHQIKTPIAAMKLTLQKEDTPFSRRLTGELSRISRYVEMVLAFLRLDSPTGDFVFREQRLDDILRPVLRKFGPEFIDRRLRLNYEAMEDTVVTDEKWLAFVLEQLLSNALKYTREGGIRVSMSGHGKLLIADTGIGIDEADLPRIFERGYTGYNGRTDKSASGIGLYLSRRVCEKLGIGISIRSQPDKGTEVTLSFADSAVTSE